MDKIPHKSLQTVSFNIYSSEEVKRLSVLEITNVNTFDTLDHPAKGGLYDSALGPCDRDECCDTCGLPSMHCPGHLGHITFPLPVFNPVLIKTLYQLLRGSCLNCHNLMAPPIIAQLTLYQFKALDYGLIGTVQTLEEVISDFGSKGGGGPVDVIALREKLKTVLETAVQDLNIEDAKSCVNVKNVVECRQQLMKNFIKVHLMGAKGKCPNCGDRRKAFILRNNNRIVFRGGRTESIKVKSKSSVSKDFTDENEIEDGCEEVEKNEESQSLYAKNYITPLEARKHLSLVWEKEKALLQRLFAVLSASKKTHEKAIDIFFLDLVVVPPSRFRPVSVLRGRKYLNPQTAALHKVLQDAILLKEVLTIMKKQQINMEEENEENLDKIQGKTLAEKLHNQWYQLQIHVNCVADSKLDKVNDDKNTSGVKQILEKKEGLFRKNMMGKRVNFAARSVISPDPYIMVDEIGVPMVFASKLTYPQPVTSYNIEQLRAAVINGPDIYPGAEKVEYEDGTVVKLTSRNEINRRAIANRLLTSSHSCNKSKKGCKKVYRHLQNGDVLLLNRQPTLHKPSIMAHRAKVLPGEKTLRLHYANCKSYNADFDGDEMNAHFPQSELARAEAYNIVSVNNQYLVPKDGTPLSGLIQDHVIAGSMLTMKNRFFTREDYQELVYGALTFVQRAIKLLPPSILKPQVLWSGKQVVSTVIINVMPEGKPPPTVEGKAKIASKNWQSSPSRVWQAGGSLLREDDMSEAQVIIRHGELLCGVLDKAHYGPTPYGLIHCCYELYGGKTSTVLLTSLARLFTHFLQIHTGFTLGVEDILLTAKANKKRWKVMKAAKKIGNEVAAKALNISDPKNYLELKEKLMDAHLSRDDEGLKQLDFEMKKKTDSFNNDINKVCIPEGLMKKFPANNLQLMVQSGAKGATVNAMQISCLLGQIELEGRRVPLMLNGSSLPSFLPYDTSPRAGGFVDGRFLTGIRPQEFFFHCMAGREGLIDTAVKTSRSGYLQRCLIKHLEGLTVNYDLTVRDSDGSVIQFLYGEDGLDIQKMQMLKKNQIPLLAKNYNATVNEQELERTKIKQMSDSDELKQMKKKIKRWKKKHPNHLKDKRTSPFLSYANDNLPLFQSSQAIKIENMRESERNQGNDVKNELCKNWYDLDFKSKRRYIRHIKKCPDPVFSKFRPDLVFGSISEHLDDIIENYISENPHNLLCDDEDEDSKDGLTGPRKFLSSDKFRTMMHLKYSRALAEPGEAVGLLAAQSIGEPSTQMTLNTFHFAGRGEMNVTLGIPRMREILMVASSKIATPTMDLPLLDIPDVEVYANKLRVEFSAVHLKQVLEDVIVKESIHVKNKMNRFRNYNIRFNFLPHKVYRGDLHTSPAFILYYIEKIFIKKFIAVFKKKLSHLSSSKFINTSANNKRAMSPTEENENENLNSNMVPDDDGGTSDEGEGDGDTISTKLKVRHDQEFEYEDPEEQEEEPDASEDEGEDDVESKPNKSSDQEENEEFSPVVSESLKVHRHKQKLEEAKPSRINHVKNIYHWVINYDFDTVKEQWCEVTLQLSLEENRLDITSLIEEEAAKTIIHSTPNINRAFLVRDPQAKCGCEKMLKTDGVNILEMFKYGHILDLHRICSNDIHAIAQTYGIEAAARVIVKEVSNVFATYGITVDPRHLILIADYMTYSGYYKPFNRIGMESNASPFQQMSFETAMNFLKSATLTGLEDQLKSPSARLIVGHPVNVGTGCFNLLQT